MLENIALSTTVAVDVLQYKVFGNGQCFLVTFMYDLHSDQQICLVSQLMLHWSQDTSLSGH